MFDPGLWFGLWFFIAIIFGCIARALGQRHRRLDELFYLPEDKSPDVELVTIDKQGTNRVK